jgi:hypothetical protein
MRRVVFVVILVPDGIDLSRNILRGLAEAREGAAQPTELEALAARFALQADG